MKLRSAGITDHGRVRENNEDAFLADDAHGLFAVADGVGGLEAGEVASRIMIEALAEIVSGAQAGSTPPRGMPSRQVQPDLSSMRRAIALANQRIYSAAQEAAAPQMGTTVTAALFRDSRLSLAHVGDSRAYRLRGQNLEQLTRDHTVVAEQVRAGKITPAQARLSPYQNVITRAVGIAPEVEIDGVSFPVRPGDRFLLCTDGLTDMVPESVIAGIIRKSGPEQAARELVREANSRGGKDNITALVIAAQEGR